ncbi:hypothetical protein DBR00_03080 [Pseudomonas sp. HMWF032]|uniref:substrate-binding periplasmic protein n=1 Tax=unclassified Pseudomonas TaxID=196821 RepID=UPI000D357CD7|nr:MULTISPECIES: transporter substrate-binding domain-containing protein [unclassified Pseudomonas]PTS84798.1 hypothetical protein DBR00_03080 [Pseudomonas sp. HMWF032]PTT85029.1 hypothetical protein DBR41_05510 [Pseudomonas sp. HMWF010]WAC46241.1 transporter substrate-binding domain-containing protein [Pseudomonas sp. SL4(2022)]
MTASRLLCLLLMMLVSAHVTASEAFMVFGAHDGFPKYYEENGEAKGIVVDISRQCLDEIQVPYRIRLMPWMRAYTMAQRGEGGVIGLSMNDERLALFDFSEPIFTERIVLVVKQGREFPFQQVGDLRGKLIGASIGASYGNVFDAAVADGTLTIIGFNETRNGLAMLMRERIDAILLGSSIDLKRLVRNNPDLQGAMFVTLPEPFKTDSKYLGISAGLKMGWFLQKFNQCLERGYRSGAFDSIIYQYSN